MYARAHVKIQTATLALSRTIKAAINIKTDGAARPPFRGK